MNVHAFCLCIFHNLNQVLQRNRPHAVRRNSYPSPIGSPQARRKSFLQVSMEQNMGCAVGACLGCVVMGSSGTPQRVCREGPVFASDELDWENGW